MKRLLFVLLMFLSINVVAQDKIKEPKSNIEQMAKVYADDYRSTLLLSNRQYKKVYKYCVKHVTKQQKIVAKQQSKMKKGVKKYLNDAQLEKYVQIYR